MAEAKLKAKLQADVKITITLTLEEAKALEKITCYGHKNFIEGYYKYLGKHYLEPHEKGVISLFETIKKTLPSAIEEGNKTVELIKSYNK